MTANLNDRDTENVRQESILWTLGLPLLLCCLAAGSVLFILDWKNQRNRPIEQKRIDFRSIPPEQIGYQQTSVFVCPVKGQATCFALWEDSTFIIGSANPPMLSFFDLTGTLLRTIDLPEEPRAVVCGTPDTLFTDKIVVAHPRSIVVYSAEGQAETSFSVPPSGPFDTRIFSGASSWSDNRESQTHSLVLTPDYLFAAETGNRCIYRFDAEGQRDLLIGDNPIGVDVDLDWTGKSFDGFVVYASPITMAFSPQSGLLYIANPGRHRVDVFTQDGIYQPELSWGEPSGSLGGFAACCNPIDVAVLDDGRILTVEKAVSRIKIFRTNGELDCVVAGFNVLEDMPSGLQRAPLEPGGRSFSAVPLSEGRIAVFDFEGLIRIFAPLKASL